MIVEAAFTIDFFGNYLSHSRNHTRTSTCDVFDEGPPLFTSKVEEWLMMTFVLENCLLDLFVVLDLGLGSILIDNFCFLSLKSWK